MFSLAYDHLCLHLTESSSSFPVSSGVEPTATEGPAHAHPTAGRKAKKGKGK